MVDARTDDSIFFGRGVYLRGLCFKGGDCGFACPLLGKLHCIPDGSPDCPVFPLHTFILSQPSMVRLISDTNTFKVFSQY